MSNVAASVETRTRYSQVIQSRDLGHYLFVFVFSFGMYL